MILQPYSYTASFAGLTTTTAATLQQTQNITINADADFLLLAYYYHAVIAAVQTQNTKPIAIARCLIVDTGSGSQFMSAPVDLENLCGGNQNGNNQLPYPRYVSGRSALAVTLTGYGSTAETYVALDFTMRGVQCRVRG